MIDVLVPCLGRPANAQPLVDSLRANSTVPCQLIFICSEGDVAQIEACKATGWHVLLVFGGDSEFPRKINVAFSVTTSPWVLIGADDISFEPGWDEIALAVAKASGARVVGTNDEANPSVQRGDFSTHPLVRRDYVEEVGATWDDGPGVLLHEGYDHNFVDVELAAVAKARNEWAFALASIIRHCHPGWKTAPDDATYRKGRATFTRDHRLFVKRSRAWARRRR